MYKHYLAISFRVLVLNSLFDKEILSEPSYIRISSPNEVNVFFIVFITVVKLRRFSPLFVWTTKQISKNYSQTKT